MKLFSNRFFSYTGVVAIAYLALQSGAWLIEAKPAFAQSTANCIKVAGNSPIRDERDISVGKKSERSLWSLRAYPNFFHLFTCKPESSLTALEGSLAIPDDSTLLSADILFYRDGKLEETIKVSRDAVNNFTFSLSGAETFAIEYRFVGGGSSDVLYALKWDFK
jgi:hypothetical protein